MAATKKHSLHSIHSWWKTQLVRKIESGPNNKTAAHAFVLMLRLGLRASLVARNNTFGRQYGLLYVLSHSLKQFSANQISFECSLLVTTRALLIALVNAIVFKNIFLLKQ